MNRTSFLPTKQEALASWTAQFYSQIAVHTAACGLTLDQVTAYQTAQEAYGAALITATGPTTRTPSAIQIKNDLKRELIELTRQYVNICQASPLMTDAIRVDLQIPIRDREPSPTPVPTELPNITIVEVRGRNVDIRLRNELGEKRWPDGASVAWVFTHVGDNPPGDLKQWTFEAPATRLDPILALPATVPPNTMFWVTALWATRNGKPGPACAPVQGYTNHIGLSQAA